MPVYNYQAINAEGKKINGSLDAETVRSARQSLRTRGIFATEINEANDGTAEDRRDVLKYFKSSKVSLQDLAVSTRQLGTLVSAGLPLVSALSALSDQTGSPLLQRILIEVREKVEEGSSLSGALEQFPNAFPGLFVTMVAGGEASGTLDTVLENLAEYLESQVELRRKVRSALIYPVIMLVICSLVFIGLFVFVVPQIVDMFRKQKLSLPLPTEIMIAISDFIIGYWLFVVVVVIAMIYSVKHYFGTPQGRDRIDALLLRAPVFGPIYIKIATARVAKTLGTLLSSGVSVLAGLEIAKNIVTNVHLSRALESAHDGVREGKSLADEIRRSGYFPPILSHMIAVGERSGELEQMLVRAGEAHEKDVSATLENLTSLLEPLMLVAVGGVVFSIVISILLPLADLINIIDTN